MIIIVIIVACGCHETGAKNNQCDKSTGQCDCKKKFTGRACDQCTDGNWGLDTGCKKCRCTNRGTVGGSSAACNKVNIITLSLTIYCIINLVVAKWSMSLFDWVYWVKV